MSALTVLVGLVEPQRVPALTAMCESLLPGTKDKTVEEPTSSSTPTKEAAQEGDVVSPDAASPKTPVNQQLAVATTSRKPSTIRPLTLDSSPAKPGTANSAAAPGTDGASPNKGDGAVAVVAEGGATLLVPPNLTYCKAGLTEVPEEPHLKAMHLVAHANILLDGGLHRCKEWVTVKDMYFNAAAHFSACDMHQEAGDTFNHSAAICRVYGSQFEIAHAASYAVESYRLADPIQCNPLFEELIGIYEAQGRIGLVAKNKWELAKNCEHLGMLPEALQYYHETIAAFARAATVERGQAGGSKGGVPQQCKVKTARISAQLGKFKEAAEIFEVLAKEVIARGVSPMMHYFHATLCWFAVACGDNFAPGYAKTKKRYLDYQDYDPLFQKGVESGFIKNLIKAWDKPSLAAFDEAQRVYNSFRPSEEWTDMVINQVRDNLFQYLLPFM